MDLTQIIGLYLGYGLKGPEEPWGDSRSRRQETFLFSEASRPGLGPTQPPVINVYGRILPGNITAAA